MQYCRLMMILFIRSLICVLFKYDVGSPNYICVEGKAKVHPRTGHEGPEGEQMYSSTLTSTSALDLGWMVNDTTQPLYPPVRTR